MKNASTINTMMPEYKFLGELYSYIFVLREPNVIIHIMNHEENNPY